MTTMIRVPNSAAMMNGDILQKARIVRQIPIKMATPPILGVGTLCILRSSRGISTARSLYARTLISGVQQKDRSPAHRTAMSP